MVCPKCGCIDTLGTPDSVTNVDRNEKYRKRKCTICNHIVYTVETVVEKTEEFSHNWNNYHRSTIRKRRIKNETSDLVSDS